MPLEMQSQQYPLNLPNTTTFTFGGPVISAMAGLTGFLVQYNNTQEDVTQITVAVSVAEVLGNQVTVSIKVVLNDDDGDTLYLQDSFVCISCLAATDDESVYLTTVLNQTADVPTVITASGDVVNAAPVLGGFSVLASDSEDVESLSVSSLSALVNQPPNTITMNASVSMTGDESGVTTTNTYTAGVIATLVESPGFVMKTVPVESDIPNFFYQYVNSTIPVSCDFSSLVPEGSSLGAAVAFLQTFTVQYDDSYEVAGVRVGAIELVGPWWAMSPVTFTGTTGTFTATMEMYRNPAFGPAGEVSTINSVTFLVVALLNTPSAEAVRQ